MDTAMSWKRLLPLMIVVTVYLCLGALVFQFIEGKPELQRREDLRNLIRTFIENNTCISHKELSAFIDAISSETTFAQGTLQGTNVSTRWDFSGSFSFVVTVATTIGYGNLAPHTGIGKVVVIAYALIGIPLTFLMLQGIGGRLTQLSHRVNKLKLCSKKPALNKYLNMVLIIVIGVSLLFIVPTILFMKVEGWDLMDAIYYCFVTLSTIGFGDFIPALSENRFSRRADALTVYRIVTYVWILFGLAYVALIISYISNILVRKAEKVEQISRKKIETEIKQLQKELSKTKSNIYSIASNVAETVNTGLDGVRNLSYRDLANLSRSNKQMDSRVSMQTAGDSTHVHASDIDIVTVKTLTVPELPMRPRSADDSLFRKSRPSCKPDPVQLVSYRRKSLSS